MVSEIKKLIVCIFALVSVSAATHVDIYNVCDTCPRRMLDSLNYYAGRNIRVNQAGYRPIDNRKFAFVAEPSQNEFSVIDYESRESVYTGTLEEIGEAPEGDMWINGSFNSISTVYEFGEYDSTASPTPESELLYRADFSSVTDTGQYIVKVGSDTSAVFWIHDKLYNQVFETALKFFGVNRCGNTHSWIHDACHLKDGSGLGAEYEGALSGGWHDCGDHGKYSETEGYAALMLTLTYCLWPEKAEDFYGKSYHDTLPFGNDGIPDVLWEAKIGVDYIFSLYKVSKAEGLIESGDMYHSVGTGPGVDHEFWDKPERQEMQPVSQGGAPRVVSDGVGSNVAGTFAATLAFFSWGWELFDPEYADSCLDAAADIYENVVMPNLGTSTDMPCCYPGGGRTDDDEGIAALALWFATKDTAYAYDLYKDTSIRDNTNHVNVPGQFPAGHMGSGSYFHHGGWITDYEQVHAPALYAFAKLILNDDETAAEYGVSPEEREELLEDVIVTLGRSITDGSNGSNAYEGDEPHETINADEPYHGVFTSVDWGYNRYNMGMVLELFLYWDLTGEQIYFDLGLDNLNYNLGMNPWDMSFIMSIGDRNLQHPHNRASNPDGYNAGGIPYEYTPPTGALMGGCKPGDVLLDDWEDYTATETCIDFSTQLLFPAQILAKDLPPDNEGPEFSNVVVEMVTQNSAVVSWNTDELSNDILYYSRTVGGEIIDSVRTEGLSMDKIVTIEDLDSSTTYYFYLKGIDVRRNESIDNNHGTWYDFTTTDTDPPSVETEGVRVCNVTDSKATVFWWTPDRACVSGVNYGTDTNLGQSVVGDDAGMPVKFHSVTLTGLEANTTYYFDVVSGGNVDDNSGNHYQFTTTEMFVDFDIYIKPKMDDRFKYIIDVSNNMDQEFTGLELRYYYKASDPASYSPQVTTQQIYGGTGQVEGVSGISVGTPTDHTGTDYWYIPITISETLPVSGRVRMEIEMVDGNWSSFPLDDFRDDWSVEAKSEPVEFDGIMLDNAPLYSGTDYVETIDGENIVSFVNTPYITAHYKGVHLYGYPPDYEDNEPEAHKTVDMHFTEPFESPQRSLEQDSSIVYFEGSTWAWPHGNITNIELNSQANQIPFTPVSGRSDSVTFDHTDPALDYGANKFTWVAWHNRDEEDCACKVVRHNIEVDTLAGEVEERIISTSPSDTLVMYTGAREQIDVSILDTNYALIDSAECSIDISFNLIGLGFFPEEGAATSVLSFPVEQGRGEVFIGASDTGTARVTLSSVPGSEAVYTPKVLIVVVKDRPPEQRYIETTPEDTLDSFYTGERRVVNVSVTDSTHTLIDTLNTRLDLSSSIPGVEFYASDTSSSPVTSLFITEGRGSFYIESPDSGSGSVSVSAEAAPGVEYAPADLYVSIDARPPWPAVSSARAVDTDCDYVPDSLVVVLTNGFQENQSLVSVATEYKGVSDTLESSEVSVRGEDTLVLPLAGDGSVDYTPTGEVTLSLDVEGENKEESGPIEDGIGPDIVSVAVLEQIEGYESAFDSMFVSFTEEIDDPGKEWVFNLFTQSGDPVDVPEVSAVEPAQGDDRTWLYVTSRAAGSSIEPGMEIQLDTSSSLTDISGNGPGPCDPSLVPIDVRYRPVPPESGVYYDTDADGSIDSVMVSFVKNLHDPHNSITPYVILESGDSIRIDSFRVNSEDTTSVVFDLRDAVSDSIEINTGRDIDLVMRYPGFADEYTRVIRDSAAPVITYAEYFPGKMVSDTGNAPDTLELRFSEDISLSSVQDSPFVIMNPDGREFRFTYSDRPQVSGDQAVFITEEPSGFPVDGAVIWINPSSGVSDRYSNQQNNPSNLRTPMVVHPRPYSLTIHVQTPVDPKTNNPVADINNAGIELNRPLSFTSGVMIEVRPLQPLNSIRLEGIEIQIFDVVGNRLINYEGMGQGEHIEFSRDRETGRLFVIWDGRNTNGRYAAKGTYLLRLRVKDSNGEYYGLSESPETGKEPWRFIKIE